MISGRTNIPDLAQGEIVVNEAELRLVEKLAAVGHAVLAEEAADKAVAEAERSRAQAGRALSLAVEAAKKGGAL